MFTPTDLVVVFYYFPHYRGGYYLKSVASVLRNPKTATSLCLLPRFVTLSHGKVNISVGFANGKALFHILPFLLRFTTPTGSMQTCINRKFVLFL